MLPSVAAPDRREPALAARLAASVRGLDGWRRWLLAAGAGALSVLAMAPFHLWPVLWLTLPVLVWLIDDALARSAPITPKGRLRAILATPRACAARAGWWFAFGYFLFGLFWIGEAFLVEAETFAVLIPFAVTLMPAGLALFWAAAVAVATMAWHPGMRRVLALALALSAAEWLRGHVLTGFPWNVLGYALTYPLPLMQWAGVLGIYGLTLVAVVLFTAPLVLHAEADVPVARWPRGLPIGLALASLAAMTLWGSLILATPDSAPTNVTVRIVQPSVPQREKWRPENQERIFRDHIRLSQQNAAGEEDGGKGIRLIVWPEAAMPFLPLNTPAALEAIGAMLPPGTLLASGGLRLDPPDPQVPGSRRRVYNSLIVFGEGGRPVAAYDKIHLVPFGEYLPAQTLLEAIGLEQLTRLRGGFDAGPRPRPLLSLPGLPLFGPLVCYEAIFPRAIVQGGERPAALLNVTNDGWFGNTTGPRQHLHQARVRALEEGLPLIRAANNGISAVIDGRGRVVDRLDLDVRASLDARLPSPVPPPLYARFGDAIFFLIWLLLGGMLGGLMKIKRTPSKST
ncbi:MAG: apolipoprotein N-acyltransferase [Hyphomicrobiaceae bacterium]